MGAERGDDSIAFFAADLGRTARLVASNVATQISDADGALPHGRYLLHVLDVTNGGPLWIAIGKFEKGGTLAVAADVPYFPMSPNGLVGFEVNVIVGVNDRIAVVTSGAVTGNLYITQISRGA